MLLPNNPDIKAMENKDKLEAKVLRGRPRKKKKKLSCSINLKLSEKDFNSVKEKAERLGMKATQYAPEMVLKGSVKLRYTLEDLNLIRKLSGMANNLNQLVKTIKFLTVKRLEKMAVPLLESIQNIINKLSDDWKNSKRTKF